MEKHGGPSFAKAPAGKHWAVDGGQGAERPEGGDLILKSLAAAKLDELVTTRNASNAT